MGLLQLVQKLGLFELEFLRDFLGPSHFLHLLLHSIVVVALEIVHVHSSQGAECRLCTRVTLSDFKELLLFLL